MMPGKDKLVESDRMNNSQCSHRVWSYSGSDQPEKRDLPEHWGKSIEIPKESCVSSRIKLALE